MGINVFASHKPTSLLSPLQGWLGFFVPREITPTEILRNEFAAVSLGPPTRLRVVRELEPGASLGCAGRMVISGRMADVCAELERMTAKADATHGSIQRQTQRLS